MKEEKTPPAPQGEAPSQTPAQKATAAAADKPAPRTKPSFHVYSRQRDQHVVGPGCWCMPKIEIVDGLRIVVHKRD